MKLTDYLPVQVGQAAAQAPKSGSSTVTGGKAFDKFLDTRVAETDRSRVQHDKPAQKSRGQTDGSKTDKADTPIVNETEQSEANPVKNADQSGQASKTTETTGKTAKDGNTGVEVKELNETLDEAQIAALTAQIAAALGISADEALRLLTALNITAADLASPENVTAFVQALYNVSAPVELLWEPGVAEAANDINKAVRTFMENLAAEQEPVATQETPVTQAIVRMPEVSLPVEVVAAESQIQTAPEPMPVEDEFATITAKPDEAPVNAKKAETPVKTDYEPLERDETGQALTDDAFEETTQTAGQRIVTTGRTETPRQTAQNQVHEADASVNPVADPFQGLNALTGQELSETAARLASSNPRDALEIISQITEQLKVEVKADTTELRLTLKPESLGEVSMRILTQNGVVTAQFFAENQRVKEIIESQLNDLKNSLQEKGIEVAEMAAFVGQDPSNRNSAGQADGGFDDLALGRTGTRLPRFRLPGTEEIPEEAETPETDAQGNPLEVNITA